MKIRATFMWLICLLLIMIFSHSPAYANDASKSHDELTWHYQRKILGNEKGYVYFDLDKEIYKYANENLSDIRIMKNNEFIPYIIETEKDLMETKISSSYQGKLINTFDKNDNSFFDFELKSEEQEYRTTEDFVINNLILSIKEQNFVKTFNIYGSYDGTKWNLLTQKELHKINDKSDLSINIDNVKYSYYRIEILKNIENIYIDEIIGDLIKTEKVNTKYNSTINLDYKIKENKENKFTEITIDNEYKTKLINLSINTNDKFYRKYEIYDEFNTLINYGILNDKNPNIHFDKYINASKIILKIFNQDNKAINVKQIVGEHLVDKIIFEKDEGDYYLLYGSKLATKPQYDLLYMKDKITLKSEIKIGEIEKINESDINNVVEEINYQLIINIIITTISILLILILLKSIKKEKS